MISEDTRYRRTDDDEHLKGKLHKIVRKLLRMLITLVIKENS